jgi:hypothetical protein
LHNLPGEFVGVNDRESPLLQNPGGGGFAHANAASEAEAFHNSELTGTAYRDGAGKPRRTTHHGTSRSAR